MNTEHQKSNDEERFDDAFSFLVKLGKAAHRYGASSERTTVFLTNLAETLGYKGDFVATPTGMIFAIEQEGRPQRQQIVRLAGPGLDLDKLARVGEITAHMTAGRISLEEAAAALDAVDKLQVPFDRVAIAACYVFVAAGLAVLFGAGWVDVAVASVLSLAVFGMSLGSERLGAVGADWLPLVTAFVSAVAAVAVKVLYPPLNVVIVVVCAVIILVPGYTVSMGVIELVSSYVVSGLTNLMNGLVYLVKQILGALLGVTLAVWLLPAQSAPQAAAVPTVWLAFFMPLVCIGLVVIFQTPKRDLVAAVVGSLFAYVAILFGSRLMDANLGNLLGTVAAVIFANLWSRRTKRPTSIVLVPAIILLVSGSIGFRGLAAMAQGHIALGEKQFLQMFIVAATIAAGLLVGNTLVRPKLTL